MPSTTRRFRLIAAIGISTMACGLVLWPIPYAEVAMLNGRPSFALWLVAGVAAGLAAGFMLHPGFLGPVLTVPAGFALAVIARVVVEGLADPTSHSLWPIEVGIAIGVGLIGGMVGAAIALGVQRIHQSSRARAASRSHPD